MTSHDPELIAMLGQLQHRYPQWRFGQLIANLAGWADSEVWDVEDQQLIQAAKNHLAQVESSTVRLKA